MFLYMMRVWGFTTSADERELYVDVVQSTDFSSFAPASESKILKILSTSPNKQTEFGPIPTWLLKECASVFVTTITNIVNFSLSSRQFHPILRESVISPLLKSQEVYLRQR